jgi:outer membrane protein OmpA-like peptidoglycan-associated protein
MWLRPVVLASFAVTLAVGCAAPTWRTPRVTTAETLFETTSEAPTFARVRITEDHLVIDDEIHFAPNSDVIQPASYGVLEEIAEVLKVHSEIDRLDVIGHTDNSRDEALSLRRAAAVAEALRQAGVLTLIGVRGPGDEAITCADDTGECLDKQRRVEFVINKRDQASG